MKKFSIFFLSLIIIRKFHLSWLKYACCTVLSLSFWLGGKTQMHFVSNQNPDFMVMVPSADLGFIITDPYISSNLSKGFEFRITVNTDHLDPDRIYNIFTVGYYMPSSHNPKVGEFCSVIKLALMDGTLRVCRVIDQPADELVALRLWKSDMVPDDQGLRTIKFNIDSFSTKIYSYDPTVTYSNDQSCELWFWGLLGSEVKRVFEDPCWPGAFPAVLLPVDQAAFVSADLYTFSHINISPPSSDPATGGSPATPQSRVAGQKETCSCPADSLSLRKKKNITRKTAGIPKTPKYLRTTSVFAEDKAEKKGAPLLKWNIYPNPFSRQTIIEFNIAKQTPVTISLWDLSGKRIKVLFESSSQPPGNYQVRLDAAGLSSGEYLVRLQAQDYEETKKIIITQ